MTVYSPGDYIAAAAINLTGYLNINKKEGHVYTAPGPADVSSKYSDPRKNNAASVAPPNKGYGGNWTVWNKMKSSLSVYRNACCDCFACAAIRWSGVDDEFPNKGCADLFKYMTQSKKWDRVGGVKKYWTYSTALNGGNGDSGVTIQPGDVLIKAEVETKRAKEGLHICIYVGKEVGNLKYPNSNATYCHSSFGKKWPYATRLESRTEQYIVFRRNEYGLNIDKSKYAKYEPAARKRYLISSIENTSQIKLSITEIAKQVLDGKWGSGAQRKKKLQAAGYDYNKIQDKVNDILYTKIAKEVIAGKWGNAQVRKKKLEAAGYDYNKVQNKVNTLLK